MLLIIFALVCGIIILLLLIRSMAKNTRDRLRYGSASEKICEVLKIIACVETVAFIVIFIIVLIKTIA